MSCSLLFGEFKPLTRVIEHASSEWVALHFLTTDQNGWPWHLASELPFIVWADQNHWQEWLNLHPASELLYIVWVDQHHWQKWWNMHPGCVLLSIFWADLMRVAEHTSSMWVTLHCWAYHNHWWEWLNTSSMWVAPQHLSRSDHWQEYLNMHPGGKSLSSVWADQNHWLNMHPASELLFIVWGVGTTNENGWTNIQYVSCSPLFEEIRWEWLNTHLVSELLFSVWEDQNHWWEWLNTHPECELLFIVWSDQNHWWEWLNTSSMWVAS